MRNNRGWLRIVEASISILIVLSVLVIVYVRAGSSNQPDLSERARDILEEMATNNTLRAIVLEYPPLDQNKKISDDNIMNTTIRSQIPEASLSFEWKVCTLEGKDAVCGKTEYSGGSIYVGERIISAYVGKDAQVSPTNAKKIRLFIWRIEQ